MRQRIARRRLFDGEEFRTRLAAADDATVLFRDGLRAGRVALRKYHDQGASSQELVESHAWLVDQILTEAWALILACSGGGRPIALLAAGGYGRGELHPCSDVDLLLLLERGPERARRERIERFIRFLWDIGLEVGHSVRTTADCVREARRDITVVTNLMEARLLCGDPALFEQVRSRTGPARMWNARRFFEAKRAEQVERHLRFDDTAYNLEPHVKEGPGGLRDIQTIVWVAQRFFDTANLSELVERGFLSDDEYRSLIRGRNFLWRVRNGLHYLASRREDRLLFDHQRELARSFGYRDRAGSLAVEQLMKRYYRTIKELRLLNEILLQHFEEAILSSGRRRRERINRRFRSVDGYLEAADDRTFERYPFALIELFLILQQNPALKGVRASTIRLVRSSLHIINAEFRRDIRCRTLFMEIFRQPSGLTHALRRMNAYGVLGAYLPEFGRVIGQMQHDLFHVYTVDAHLLIVVRNLRRMAMIEHRGELPQAHEIMSRVFKPHRLYLAGLFHDIGKGRGGDHSSLGEKDAYEFCRDHDMSDYDAHFVAWLVRHHLLMSWTAQRQDISDPAVVDRFAELVGDQEHLDNLYLLTIADMRGTSPHVWNEWKGQLLAELHAATTRALRRGIGSPLKLSERIADTRRDALEMMRKEGIDGSAADGFWQYLDDDYFVRNPPESIAWHTRAVINARLADLPLVCARYLREYGASQYLICAAESESLFSNVAGGFDRLNLNIVDARVHPLRSGLVLLVFTVLDENSGDVGDEPLAGRVRRLRQQILDPQPGRDPRKALLSRALKHFPIRTAVNFAAAPGGQWTMMEVVAQDRPGLLYQVSRALLHCKVLLVSAKVATFGERVEDIFYITDRDGNPVQDSERQRCIRERIESSLGGG